MNESGNYFVGNQVIILLVMKIITSGDLFDMKNVTLCNFVQLNDHETFISDTKSYFMDKYGSSHTVMLCKKPKC